MYSGGCQVVVGTLVGVGVLISMVILGLGISCKLVL